MKMVRVSALPLLILMSASANAQATLPNVPCNAICTPGPEITPSTSPAEVIAQCLINITTSEQSGNLANAFRNSLSVGRKTNLFALNNANKDSCPVVSTSVFGLSEDNYSIPLYGSILQATVIGQAGPPTKLPGTASITVSFQPSNALVFTSPTSLK
jgi:hypothetical protein